MTGLKSTQMPWMELQRKLNFTILIQVKKKIIFFPFSKEGSTHLIDGLVKYMRPILTSSSENLCENESICFHCCLVLKVMTQPAQYAKEKM